MKIYINQDIYIIPDFTISRQALYSRSEKKDECHLKGYGRFKNQPTLSRKKIDVYKGIICDPNLYYTEGAEDAITEYNALTEKYLKILDVIINKQNAPFFKLLNKENSDTLYFFIAETDFIEVYTDQKVPFIFVGHFEKLKKNNVGKEFIMKDISNEIENEGDVFDDNDNYYESIDINTGLPVKFHAGSKWKCIDITLVKGEPKFIFKNEENEEIQVDVSEKEYNFDRDDFLTKEEAKAEEERKRMNATALEALRIKKGKDRQARKKKLFEEYKNRFGERYTKLIMAQKVVIGMSKDMCRAAWGAPYDINKITTSSNVIETWTYSMKTFLYFEDNKLTLIKN